MFNIMFICQYNTSNQTLPENPKKSEKLQNQKRYRTIFSINLSQNAPICKLAIQINISNTKSSWN